MPIRPERQALYPPDWKAIRMRILHRAGGCCEFTRADGSRCSAPNDSLIARDVRNLENWWAWDFADAYVPPSFYKLVRIVLTIAHLDHDETHCSDENLKAGCQLHHLRHDVGATRAHAPPREGPGAADL